MAHLADKMIGVIFTVLIVGALVPTYLAAIANFTASGIVLAAAVGLLLSIGLAYALYKYAAKEFGFGGR